MKRWLSFIDLFSIDVLGANWLRFGFPDLCSAICRAEKLLMGWQPRGLRDTG